MKNDASVRVPGSPCPSCGKVLDAARSITQRRLTPQPGDISICLYCRAINIFEGNSLRSANAEEREAALALIKAQALDERRN
jgi:hypothetical protein